MAIFNLGSINNDIVYWVPHLPQPGETLSSTHRSVGLGGKGANQSVAAARGGARAVHHIGFIGEAEAWIKDALRSDGIDSSAVAMDDVWTGEAIITVDSNGENHIVLSPGANFSQSPEHIERALSKGAPGDLLLMQNETNGQMDAARIAKSRGMRVIYSAAPFEAEKVKALLPLVDILAVNALECEQLCTALGLTEATLPVPELLVTRGAEGAEWRNLASGEVIRVGSFPVDVVDTTGAGDTFIGYVAAGLDRGEAHPAILRMASAAAAICVRQQGALNSIPLRAVVTAFLERQG